MTAYHGGKQRLGLQIANVITYEVLDRVDDGFELKGYCEPFCGMLGVYQHIPKLFEPLRSGCEPKGCEEESTDNIKYLAGDINESVIMMWQAAQKGWKPPIKSSKQKYEKFKITSRPSAEKGFIGHVCSYGGIYLSSFQPSRCDVLPHSSNKVLDIATDLHNINFKPGVYTQFSNLKGYVIYCDPPYKNIANKNNNYYDENKKLLKFDHDKFWEWVRLMSIDNIIFISEFSAPNPCKLVKEFTSILGSKGNKGNQIECLFLI
jgi:site-specific DNA-adenine methylase